MVNVLRIHPDDNVVSALADIPEGTRLEPSDRSLDIAVTALEEIPFGHKVAIVPIAEGETVLKYGASIGRSTQDIAPGRHVHVHNLRSVRGAARS